MPRATNEPLTLVCLLNTFSFACYDNYYTDVALPSTPPKDKHCSIDSLDSDTLEDLQQQLDEELDRIISHYSSYVNLIRESLKATGITVSDFSSDLLSVSAFNHSKQNRILLSAHITDLKKADSLNAIFDILVTEYASFLNYKIFEHIAKTYQLNNGQDEFKYPEHLETYIKKHKISEFIKINPLIEKLTSNSTEMILKFDIESTCRLAKLKKLKSSVAKILGLSPSAIQLYDIKDGCVVATFLIPTPVAELVFNADTVLTEEQEKELQALQVLWLKCNGFAFVGKEPEDTHSLSCCSYEESILMKKCLSLWIHSMGKPSLFRWRPCAQLKMSRLGSNTKKAFQRTSRFLSFRIDYFKMAALCQITSLK